MIMKETFININESYTGNIIFRDLSQMLVEGRGIILIKLKNGDKSSYQKFLCSRHENNILGLRHFLEKDF